VTISELGSIGEFVGAIGVVLSLLYVGYQVRQNTKSLRVNSLLAVRQQTDGIANKLLQPGVASLYLRGLQDYPDMSPEEGLQFSWLAGTMLNNAEIEWNQEREGLTAQGKDWSIERRMLREPGTRRLWDQVAPGAFGNDFRAFVESELLND
jgi:hypothetical protein